MLTIWCLIFELFPLGDNFQIATFLCSTTVGISTLSPKNETYSFPTFVLLIYILDEAWKLPTFHTVRSSWNLPHILRFLYVAPVDCVVPVSLGSPFLMPRINQHLIYTGGHLWGCTRSMKNRIKTQVRFGAPNTEIHAYIAYIFYGCFEDPAYGPLLKESNQS